MTLRWKQVLDFFLGINPKLTLQKSLKDKIDDIITWLDLDDDDTTLLMKDKTSGDTVTQEIVIPAFDMHHKLFCSSNGKEGIIITVYEIFTSPKQTTFSLIKHLSTHHLPH